MNWVAMVTSIQGDSEGGGGGGEGGSAGPAGAAAAPLPPSSSPPAPLLPSLPPLAVPAAGGSSVAGGVTVGIAASPSPLVYTLWPVATERGDV